MNERAAPPAAPPPQPRPARQVPVAISGRDREFLPAALEILETPPPPLPIALMATIAAFALAALVWSFFGRLDVHATAPGKIETVGYAKVIEPLDPGKVAAIHVHRGQTVRTGDLLLELDPAEADADALSAQDALNASLAEIARRRYAITAVRTAESEVQSAQDRLDARSKDDAAPGADLARSKAWPGRPNRRSSGTRPCPNSSSCGKKRCCVRISVSSLTRSRPSIGRWRKSWRRKSA